MDRCFLALVCAAMVFLGASRDALAEKRYFQCTSSSERTYSNGTMTTGGHRREVAGETKEEAEAAYRKEREASIAAQIASGHIVSGNVRWVKCEPTKYSKKKASDSFVPVPPPPLPPAQAPKPSLRQWTCRVKLTWQIGSRRGSVDETWDDIEARSEGEAMGLAIARSQSRLKALSLAGTNPAWPSTDAKCV